MNASDVHWVVNDNGELGVEIQGRFFFCYKGESLEYDSGTHDNGSAILVRRIGKREFGETVWPSSWIQQGRSEGRYAVELSYHAGLSDGEPDAPEYHWNPIPRISNNS